VRGGLVRPASRLGAVSASVDASVTADGPVILLGTASIRAAASALASATVSETGFGFAFDLGGVVFLVTTTRVPVIWVDEVLCGAMRGAGVTIAYNDGAGRILPKGVEISRCVNVL